MNYKRGLNREKAIAADQSFEEGEYWLKKLSGKLVKSSFPADYIHGESGERKIGEVQIKFGGELIARLIQVSNNSDYRLQMILAAALVVLLNRYTGNHDIIIGAPILRQGIEGEFINTVLVLRNQVQDHMTFIELLMQVKTTVDEAIRNQNYPIEALLNQIDMPISDDEFPLFDAALSLENIQDKKYLEEVKPNILFVFTRKDQWIEGVVEYNTSLYDESTVNRIIRCFTNVLEDALFNVNKELGQLEILSREERKQMLFGFNNNNGPFSQKRTIHQRLEACAEKAPGNTAICFSGRDYTYRQINERANLMAGYLRREGVNTDRLVGVLLPRSPEMVTCILAIWKVGGAYIPIDAEDPHQRILDILEDSNAAVLLTQSQYVQPELEQGFRGRLVELDHENDEMQKESLVNPDLDLDINRLAYVIYTSGSTGKPKGVMVEHIGMMNHIQAKINDLRLTARDIIAQNASHTFDISVWQFFTPLTLGGKTIIYPNEVVMDVERFLFQLIENRVTVMELVPSYLSVILDYLEHNFTTLDLLRYLLVTGEAVKPNLLKRWFEKYPAIKVVNAYGPTEASDDITHYIMDRAPQSPRVPIGKPVLGLNIYILDEKLRLCPIGVKGEISVSGAGVGRGYLNNPELTAKKFISNPYASQTAHLQPPHPLTNLYKTGDLGCWLPDGTIEFFGRKDFQIKIRGFRIELGEIESKMVGYPGILETVVIDREEAGGDKYLCAYFTADSHLETADIKAYLSRHLPDYMIPAHLVELTEIPLTANGKVDRKALPEPETDGTPDIPYITKEMLDAARDTAAFPPTFILTEDEQENFLNNIETNIERERFILEIHSQETGKTYYPLTYPQRMIYFAQKQYPENGCENLTHTIIYDEILDKKLLEKAFNNALLKNDSLRLRLVEIEYQDIIVPAQYVGDVKTYRIDNVDFTQKNQNETYRQWVKRNNKEYMNLLDHDLFYFSYIKLTEKTSGYYIKFHHSISDGSTALLLIKEIDKTYRDLEAGKPMDTTFNPSYIDYILAEQEYLKSPATRDDMKFWHDYLLPLPEEVDLSARPNETGSIEGELLTLPFPASVQALMYQYRDTSRVSLYKQILSTLSIYILRVTGINDFVIGTLNHNRATDIFKRTDGAFISFLPARMKVDENEDFHHFVLKTNQDLNDLLKNHQKYPFGVLVNELREKTGVDTSYFYNVNLIVHPELKEADYQLEHHATGYEPTPVSIHINFPGSETHQGLELEWNYQVERFTEHDIRKMHQQLINILEDALSYPGKKLSEIQLVLEEEKKEILYTFGRRVVDYPEHLKHPLPSRNYILSENGALQPVGVLGELYVDSHEPDAGDGKKMINNPFEESGYLYKTGEMAEWLPNGDIRFSGCVEKQVHLKGRRINVGQMEDYLLEHSDIGAAVIVQRDRIGHKYLCAFIVGNKKLSQSQLKEYLSGKFPSNILPSAYINLEELPITYEGKVDRRKLETIDIEIGMDASCQKPSNEIEETLVRIWEKVLGRDNIGINEEFFMIGGDSIKAIQIASRMKSAGYRLDVRELFVNPSVAELAPLVTKLKRVSDQSVVTGIVPLTPIQKDFFALSTIDRHHYNQSVMLYSEKDFDREAIKAVFSKIQEHHDVLRMTVKEERGEMIQIIRDLNHPLSFQEFDFRNQENARGLLEIKVNEIQAGINLEAGPLMKLGLFRLQDGDRLLIAIHHLVIDGVSWRILFEDIERLYHQYKNGEKLELPLKTDPYKLWAERLSEYANSEALLEEKDYWGDMEAKIVPVINKDFEEESNWKKDKEIRSFHLSEEETHLLLTKVNEAFGTEINDILLTALGLTIKRCFNHEGVLIALEGHGREPFLEDVDINRTVGWFTSIYPVMLDISFQDDLARQIKETKEILRRVPNKGVGYGILKYLTETEYKGGMLLERRPQISFNYMGQFDAEVGDMSFKIANESVGITKSRNREAEYELDVMGMITGKQLAVSIVYNSLHYKTGTIETLLGYYQEELVRLITYCSTQEERELTPSDLTYKELSIGDIEEIESLLDV